MAIPGFFRQNKPRGFKYVPRYYDPQKEEWDQKRMARSMEHADDPPDGGEAVPQSGRARGMEHRARGMEQVDERSEEPERSGVRRSQIPQGGRAEGMEHGANGKESGEKRAVSPVNKPYRSKIMRGSMKNYFPRNREKLQKQSMIRFIVILIILAFVIYIYLRY